MMMVPPLLAGARMQERFITAAALRQRQDATSSVGYRRQLSLEGKPKSAAKSGTSAKNTQKQPSFSTISNRNERIL